MKRKIVLSVAIIFCVALLVGTCYYFSLPDYKIHTSISNSNSSAGTRETTLDVAVYVLGSAERYAELMSEIEREHMEVNDYMDTELTINLYHWSTRGERTPFMTETFEY